MKIELSPDDPNAVEMLLRLLARLHGGVLKRYGVGPKRRYVISRRPAPSAVACSPAQRVQRDRMKIAAAFRHEVLADPVRLAHFTRLSEQRGVSLRDAIQSEALRNKPGPG